MGEVKGYAACSAATREWPAECGLHEESWDQVGRVGL